jgi:hypothetical protein
VVQYLLILEFKGQETQEKRGRGDRKGGREEDREKEKEGETEREKTKVIKDVM